MADNGGGSAFLGFILGGLVVVVAFVALAMYTGNFGGSRTQLSIEMPRPTIPTPR